MSTPIKPGDKVFVSNPTSDYFGKGTFEVHSVDAVTGNITIKTKRGYREYKPGSITSIKPLPPDFEVSVKPKSPSPAADEKAELMDFFKKRNHSDVSNICPRCGKKATALSFSIVCSNTKCQNFRP